MVAACRKRGARLSSSAIVIGTLLFSPSAHAQFVIKNPAVEEGELALVGHGSYESALPGGGDPVGWGHEVEAAYGFTDFWKSTLALELKQPVRAELEPTEFKIENYLEFIDYAPSHVVFSAFGAVNLGLTEGVANAAKFGPLVSFGDDDLSLTVNAIFDKSFGKYHEPGTGLDYAAQFKFALAEGIAIGAELFGDIPNLEDVPSFNDTEFRVGPVLYFARRSAKGNDARNVAARGSDFGFTADVGVLLGTTDATPDMTVKWDMELTF
jgi:hypothetical protein